MLFAMPTVSTRTRRVLPWAAPLAVVTATMGVISAAWACVPMAKLVSLQPDSSGPSGSRVVVNGLGFEPNSVEVRWNAADGPRLGAARGPNFSVSVTIPKAPEGLHTLIAVERQQDGSIGNTGSAPFDVTARGEAPSRSGSATGRGDGPRTESAPSSERSSDPSWVALAAAGAVLLAIGALGGALMTRVGRRPT